MTTSAAPPRSASEQARLEKAVREMFEHRVSFNELLGLRIDSFDPGSPLISFEMRPALIGAYQVGRLHGGVIAAVLDATGGLGMILAICDKHRDEPLEQIMHRLARVGTIDLRVEYLRQGLGKRFLASTRTTRLGGRIGSTQMQLVNDSGALIATGAAAYVIS